MTPLLFVDGVGKSYGRRSILSSATLRVDAGVIAVLLGRNGAGKSTLLKIAAGRVVPDYGIVRLKGRYDVRARPHVAADHGLFYLPDRALLSPGFSIRQHLEWVQRRYRHGDVELVAQLTGISGRLDQRPSDVSGGELRRAELAVAMLRRPDCLLADEPYRGIAPNEMEILSEIFRRMAREQGCGVVLAGHDAPTLLAVADQVIWCVDGTSRYLGHPSAACHDPRFRQGYLGSLAARSNSSLPNIEEHVGQDMKPDDTGIDPATLHDLGVLSTSTPRGHTVFGLVDRTRTRAGREALRRRLVVVSQSVSHIEDLQHAHRSLAIEAASYRALINRADTDNARKYLDSKWQLPSARPTRMRLAQGVVRPAWFRQYLDEIGSGQICLASLLNAVTDLSQKLSVAEAGLLRENGTTLASLLATPEIQALLDLVDGQSTSRRLAFDQLARTKAKSILIAMIERIGVVEAMWSLGVATAEHGWSYPRPGKRLYAAGLFHPFLGRQAVRNNLDLDERVRVCFVTGPNMAGKSTFLKSVAMAVLLAHVGAGVPADSMEFPAIRTIFSSVQIFDNLNTGESFYLAEVRRIRALATALCDHGAALGVLDEPFRGTNVHDAAEATLAVISRLMSHPSALVFIASHIADIAPAIMDDPRVSLLHFAADVTTERPVFDYRLRCGLSTQRLGMVLLEQEGVLGLLERASRRADA